MRTTEIVVDEYYHLYNRGVNKQDIFLNERDYLRFLFLILHFQSPTTFFNLEDYINYYIKHRVFNVLEESLNKISSERLVSLSSFCLMPNHFHLQTHETQEGGTAKYMQRVLNAYSKYFNIKYKKSGHVFQGPYKAVHIENNTQLLHLSAYIHLNPRDLPGWKNKEEDYPWSSYQDFTKNNRWKNLLVKEIIEEQFDEKNSYKNFLETSPEKVDFDEFDELEQVPRFNFNATL